jgi:hypothetical protein
MIQIKPVYGLPRSYPNGTRDLRLYLDGGVVWVWPIQY